MNNCTIAPFQIAVCIGLIYQQVGVGAFVGLGLMIVLIPFNGFIFTMLNDVRRKKVGFSDIRVKLMNEILAGIRVIKFYAWENAFSVKIRESRNKELVELKKLAYIIAIGFTLIMFSLPIVQPILIFYTWVKLGNPLDAAKAFTTIALFNLMQLPFAFLPMGLAQYSQSLVSTKRMMDFFSSEELDEYVKHEENSDGSVIKFHDVSMSWILEENLQEDKKEIENKQKAGSNGLCCFSGKKPPYDKVKQEQDEKIAEDSKTPSINRSVHTLTNINISIKKGQLVAVVGPVGCGKTSLICGILGELHLKQGDVNLAGSIAYCPQQPWILNQTLKDNVLFGLDYDEEKFNMAISVASLNADIAILPAGVMTEIGERGINLSGGQKARVSIARAVYRNADIYLLDDPLSAVDAHVGQHIFSKCIQEALAGKTRILVTNQTHLLGKCDQVIIMAEGCIKAMGSYESIQTQGVDLSAYIPKVMTTSTSQDNLALAVTQSNDKDKISSKDEEKDVKVEADKSVSEKAKKGKLMTIEEKNLGNVQLSAYLYYLRSGGIAWFFLVILFSLTSQVVGLISNFYLGYWCKVSVIADLEGNSFSSERNLKYLNTFAWISMIGVFTITLRSLCLANHRLGTSSIFHEGLLQRTMGAPISFFDVTPLGRILNRFSSDMSVIDEELSQTISQVFNSFSQCLGAIGAVAGSTKGTFLILIIPLLIAYNSIQAFFRKTNTVIARLEAISRSPIYSEFSQALTGVNSIRAYKDGQRFIDALEKRLNQNSIAGVTQQLVGQWLAIRLDILGALISFFIALITATSKGFIPAEFLALGLSYSFQLTTFLKFAVRMSASLEAQMNAVERIQFYINEIEQENTTDPLPEKDIPSTWPEHGVIKGTNLSLRYREGPLVLKGISMEINSSEKIGVVGRTGSGKSSLMNALYRIHELADGTLLIDNFDIKRIPLHILRSKLGIVPQDPVMFSATVRFNLDPFNQHNDTEVWNALEMVEMKDHVTSLPNKLLEEVAEGGENFSAGQRQLICIGKSIINNNNNNNNNNNKYF
jgi:ABC-type multidrug transport system fused ATPase/permease subunit